MKTKSVRQTATINAKPSEIYDALMDSKKHGKFTGGKASISNKVGGKFTVYNGYINGVNLELKKNKKIVQSWQAKDWPKEHYSRVTFNLAPNKGGTKISFYHSGIPANQAESIKKGWIDFYWNPLKKMHP
jgi:activator of HSP90 ATPase